MTALERKVRELLKSGKARTWEAALTMCDRDLQDSHLALGMTAGERDVPDIVVRAMTQEDRATYFRARADAAKAQATEQAAIERQVAEDSLPPPKDDAERLAREDAVVERLSRRDTVLAQLRARGIKPTVGADGSVYYYTEKGR